MADPFFISSSPVAFAASPFGCGRAVGHTRSSLPISLCPLAAAGRAPLRERGPVRVAPSPPLRPQAAPPLREGGGALAPGGVLRVAVAPHLHSPHLHPRSLPHA